MSVLRFIPTPIYISLYYWAATGKWPDLKHPTYFNEKLQWMKIHEDYTKYRDYADKIKVRNIIEEKIGDGYMFPMLGKWKSFDEIDFDSLPEEFVLKCNHDSGSVKVIRNKSALTDKDIESLRKFYNSRLKQDFYGYGREPCYKGIDRYVFAEKFMKDPSGDEGGIKDYKFFCFNGKPEIMSEGIKFVRIDLFELGGKIYFSEFTFFHGGGFNRFYPVEWETKLGNLIDINTK